MKTMGGWVQCSGTENSTKTPFWSKSFMTTAEKDALKIYWGTNDEGVTKSWNSGGWAGDGQGWGNEFCPKGCVNDCAEFKLGGFLSCGYEPHGGQSGWAGYDGARNRDSGPNKQCPQNVVRGTGASAWTWCGEQKKRCRISEAAKLKIKGAKAAKKAARAALKLSRQAFLDAKNALTDAQTEAAAECED